MKQVRYTKDFDFKPSRAVTMVRKAGEERDITEAEFAAASEAGAVEVVAEKGPKAREAAKAKDTAD